MPPRPPQDSQPDPLPTAGDPRPQPPPASPPDVLRLGVVSYLNMAPLIAGLDSARLEIPGAEGPAPRRLRVVAAPPSRLAALMDAGGLDVGMVPAGALLERPDWRIVGRTIIGSRGAVRSVLALAKVPPERWRVFHPDAQSRSSNALFEVLAARALGLNLTRAEPLPADAELDPDRTAPDEVHVLIGSRANRARARWAARGGLIYDMGQMWFDWTGLPFIFAAWAAPAAADLDALRVAEWMALIERRAAENRSNLDSVIADWPDRDLEGQTPAEARVYLTEHIKHDLEPEALAGLERFHKEGRAIGLFSPDWSLARANATGLEPTD